VVDARLTAQQGVLVLRYAAGRYVLGRMRNLFLLKYVVLALGAVVIAAGGSKPLGAALVVLFLLAALAQWFVARLIRGLGALDRLSGLDRAWDSATPTSWWPNLQRELDRVGIGGRPWTVLRVAAGFARRRLPPEQAAALRQIDWRAVLPIRDWQQAYRSLDQGGARVRRTG
jgi:hypothetical protein